ncbi:MAG TPA: hypothetical protein VGB53_08970 [Rubricoccaceae bacterium]|jgi:hypothetical protein
MPTATQTPPAAPRKRAAPRPAPRPTPRPTPALALAARKARRGTALPGWADLDGAPTGVAGRDGRAAAGQRKATQLADRKAGRPVMAARLRPFDVVPSLRFGLLVVLACVIGTIFVAHVYATRSTLAELQDARRENVRLRLAGQRLRGEFDHMTGPDAVMPRATALGLVEGVAYGVPVELTAEID